MEDHILKYIECNFKLCLNLFVHFQNQKWCENLKIEEIRLEKSLIQVGAKKCTGEQRRVQKNWKKVIPAGIY